MLGDESEQRPARDLLDESSHSQRRDTSSPELAAQPVADQPASMFSVMRGLFEADCIASDLVAHTDRAALYAIVAEDSLFPVSHEDAKSAQRKRGHLTRIRLSLMRVKSIRSSITILRIDTPSAILNSPQSRAALFREL